MGDTSATNADDTSHEILTSALGLLTATFYDDHGALFVVSMETVVKGSSHTAGAAVGQVATSYQPPPKHIGFDRK